MVNKLYVVYDDTITPKYEIQNIIGQKSFGQVVYKRKTFKERWMNHVSELKFIREIYEFTELYNINKVIGYIENIPSNVTIIHMFSDYLIKNEEEFDVVLEKMQYVKDIVLITSDREIVGCAFPDKREYIDYLRQSIVLKNTKAYLIELEYDKLESDAFYNINNLQNFMNYLTSGFDARFFNSLSGDNYTVVKSSTNKKKIKMEYTFYYLIPDEMKSWFVLPYNYIETEEKASYTMERLHMTDIAIRWVHGAISMEEFCGLLDKIFYFIQLRSKKIIDKDEYVKRAESLYIIKVEERIEELKKSEQFLVFDNYIKRSSKYQSIDEIIVTYKELYQEAIEKMHENCFDVVGHGDLCFSNMLYNKDTQILKLIDTKGALKEEEIWTNPYYDLAKLSHSICGKYDFFNSGLYDIRLNENLEFELNVEFDNTQYKEKFKEYLNRNGFDYKTVRILEASLFLSMLPLHMDNPQKVFGFILNAINILEEIKNV